MTKKMMIIAGLTLVVMSVILGAVHAAYTLPRLQEQRSSHLVNLIEFMKEGEIDLARAAVEGFQKAVLVKERVASSHSHLALVGILAVLLGLLSPLINLSEVIKILVGIVYLIGALTLPVGVFLEAVGRTFGASLAVAGGIVILASTTLFLALFVLYEQSGEEDKK